VVWELTSEGTTQRCGVGLVRERKRAERRAQHSQPVVYGMGWGEAEDLNKRGLEIGGRYSCMCRGRRKGGGAVSVRATSKRSMRSMTSLHGIESSAHVKVYREIAWRPQQHEELATTSSFTTSVTKTLASG